MRFKSLSILALSVFGGATIYLGALGMTSTASHLDKSSNLEKSVSSNKTKHSKSVTKDQNHACVTEYFQEWGRVIENGKLVENRSNSRPPTTHCQPVPPSDRMGISNHAPEWVNKSDRIFNWYDSYDYPLKWFFYHERQKYWLDQEPSFIELDIDYF